MDKAKDVFEKIMLNNLHQYAFWWNQITLASSNGHETDNKTGPCKILLHFQNLFSFHSHINHSLIQTA